MRHADDLGLDEYRAAIAVTRLVLGPTMRVQAPPNLVDARRVPALLGRRRRRLGRRLAAHPGPRQPRAPVAVARPAPRGHRRRRLRPAPRLTVHPEYVAAPASRGSTRGSPPTSPRSPARRRPRAARRTTRRACRGRSPTAASPPSERHRPHRPARRHRHRPAAPPTAATTSTPSTATGTRSREVVRGRPRPRIRLEIGAQTSGTIPAGRAALRGGRARPGRPDRRAGADPDDRRGRAARRRSCRLADDLRRETVGDEVTYVVNRNINFTNVCYVGCRFCAFAQRRTDADAYSLSLDQVADRAEEAWDARRDRGLHAGRHRPASCPAPPTSTSPPR